MACVKLKYLYTVSLLILGIRSGSAVTTDLEWRMSAIEMPSSFFSMTTQNVLRCGALCERQGSCSAVTFDTKTKICYMHGTIVPTNPDIEASGSSRRYLVKNYSGKPHLDAPAVACDRWTQINIPTIHHKNGGCRDIAPQWRWKCLIYTTNILLGGTDSDVQGTILGWAREDGNGEMLREGPIIFDDEADNQEAGTVDTFEFTTQFAVPRKIEIELIGTDWWHLNKVELKNIDTGKSFSASYNDWFKSTKSVILVLNPL